MMNLFIVFLSFSGFLGLLIEKLGREKVKCVYELAENEWVNLTLTVMWPFIADTCAIWTNKEKTRGHGL
jgi:hypothetical protein